MSRLKTYQINFIYNMILVFQHTLIGYHLFVEVILICFKIFLIIL